MQRFFRCQVLRSRSEGELQKPQAKLKFQKYRLFACAFCLVVWAHPSGPGEARHVERDVDALRGLRAGEGLHAGEQLLPRGVDEELARERELRRRRHGHRSQRGLPPAVFFIRNFSYS